MDSYKLSIQFISKYNLDINFGYVNCLFLSFLNGNKKAKKRLQKIRNLKKYNKNEVIIKRIKPFFLNYCSTFFIKIIMFPNEKENVILNSLYKLNYSDLIDLEKSIISLKKIRDDYTYLCNLGKNYINNLPKDLIKNTIQDLTTIENDFKNKILSINIL